MLIFALLIACSQDVSIMKIADDEPSDTSVASSDSQTLDTQGDAPSDTPPEGFGGLFVYELTQVACPACFGLYQEITVSSEMIIYDPSAQSQLDWALNSGECLNDFSIYRISNSYIDLGSYITVSSNGINFTLNKQNNNVYYNNNLIESQYQRDSIHEIYSNDNYISSFVSIHGFDYIEPYEMLYVDPSYAFAARIPRNNAAFYWGPNGSNSMLYITIDIYSYDGSQMLGSVTCASDDSGHMTVPQQYLSQYQQGSLLAIKLTRFKLESYELEFNNSSLETYMKWEVYGTGYLQ